MNKADLIAAIAAKTGDTKKVAESTVKCFCRSCNKRFNRRRQSSISWIWIIRS